MSFSSNMSSPAAPLRVGIIGAGRRAMTCHLPALKSLGDAVDVVAVCDLQKERRDMVARDFPGARMYRRLDDMFYDQDIDIVVVALPSNDHVGVVVSALEHGFWTVGESPFGYTEDEARMILDAGSSRVGFLPYVPGFFSPEFNMACSMRDDPRLGEIVGIRISRRDFVRRRDWLSLRRTGGGVSYMYLQEAVMQALALLRAQPSRMWGEFKRLLYVGDAEDYARVIFETRDGITAEIVVGDSLPPPHGRSVALLGNRGELVVDSDAAECTLKCIAPDFEFERCRTSVRSPALEKPPSIPFAETRLEVPDSGRDVCRDFWLAVASTVRDGSPFPVSVSDVVSAVKYVQLARQGSMFFKQR